MSDRDSAGRRRPAGDVVVLKFGGTSVASPRRVRIAARRLAAHAGRGRRVVAVVSAAAGATDGILKRARRVTQGAEALSGERARAAGRELDRALATGEDRSAALLALALNALGVPARSLRGAEAGLGAEGDFGAGRIREVHPAALVALLDAGIVPVVSGFQAARADGETVTLGRGASDATAVALAAALDAECHIVTDVAAVFDRDPNRESSARPFGRLDHGQLTALAAAGAKVVQAEAARLAERTGVQLRIYAWNAPVSGRGGTLVAMRPVEAA